MKHPVWDRVLILLCAAADVCGAVGSVALVLGKISLVPVIELLTRISLMSLKSRIALVVIAILLALFALLLIAGALAGFSYGMIADENSEYRILKANAAEYACRLLGEEHSVSRALLKDAPRISQSIERDHGIAAYYPFLPAGVLLGGISRRAMMLGWHF